MKVAPKAGEILFVSSRSNSDSKKACPSTREPTAEAAWDTFSTGYGPARMLAASLDPERRESLSREFAAFHADFSTELGITVPREYWLTIGKRV